jgi:hypothetical protein
MAVAGAGCAGFRYQRGGAYKKSVAIEFYGNDEYDDEK